MIYELQKRLSGAQGIIDRYELVRCYSTTLPTYTLYYSIILVTLSSIRHTRDRARIASGKIKVRLNKVRLLSSLDKQYIFPLVASFVR